MDIKPIEYTDLEKMLIQFHEDSMGIKYVKDYAFFLKRQMIEKACKWLKFNYTEYLNDTRIGIDIDEMVKDFKMDMKGE